MENLRADKTKKRFLSFIFTCVFLELFLGGTGRLIELNSVLTLRMCLFAGYMILIGLYFLLECPLPKQVIFIISLFLFLSTFGALIGFMNGANFSAVFEDIKPLLNIFLLCYLSYYIKNVQDIRYLLKLIKISSVLLVVMHLVLYYIFLRYSDIAMLYSALSSDSGDNSSTIFFFKGDNGFVNYTGDLYLCVGFIVWDQYHKNSLLKYIVLAFLIIAIILTGTRGLIFALAGAYLIKWLILKINYRSLVYIVLGGVLVVAAFLQIRNSIGDKDESDQIRYDTIQQVVDNINPVSILIGHGFGIGVPIRPVHMEISYLEIFHKQGILGLFYYLSLFVISYLEYKKTNVENKIGFFMFVIFVYFLSCTNPYINHPLGISIISVAIICMIKLNGFKDQRELISQ